MNKQWIGITFLTVTALVLGAFNLSAQQPAQAATTVKDRDFQLVTTRTQAGGEALFVYDIRSGMIVVFSYDPTTRTLQPRANLAVGRAFGGGGGR